MTVDGWSHVDPKTHYPGVYAIGDITSVGTPKAGVFAEGATRVVTKSLIADLTATQQPQPYTGRGSCYLGFGAKLAGCIDVDFLSQPAPTGGFADSSVELVREKQHCSSTRMARWFGTDTSIIHQSRGAG